MPIVSSCVAFLALIGMFDTLRFYTLSPDFQLFPWQTGISKERLEIMADWNEIGQCHDPVFGILEGGIRYLINHLTLTSNF